MTENIYRTYLDVEIAKAMYDTVKNKLTDGRYDTTLNLDEFVYEVNKDLRRVSKDNHIVVYPAHHKQSNYYYETDYKEHSWRYWKRHSKRANRRWEKFKKKYRERTKNDMFTYGEIKILPGNIGYVEIRDFNSTSYFKKENRHRISFKSVLSFLENTKAIIIDFRENLGGYVFLSAKMCSYFSDKQNAYFITTESVFRYDSSGIRKEYKYTDKLYTDNKIKNNLISNKKIFILTSKRTFSAGELSIYKLKQLNHNTTIVGERTTGGGNGHYGGTMEKYYSAVIPCIKVFDENNSNYTIEAKGIKPDIQTTSDSALTVAYGLSLSENTDTSKSRTKYFKSQKLIIDGREEFFKKKYPDYVGDYRKITITKENERLYMTYDLYSKQLLVPEANDFFVTNDFEFIRFTRSTENKIIGIQIKHKDGYLEKFRRL
ncbi:MAG: hypothetical protein KF862_00835 [Chitinophagaceae bacterium]|nr:hypothetical protein [Chitinophagaceae bacterium]